MSYQKSRYVSYDFHIPPDGWKQRRFKPNWEARMGPSNLCHQIHLKRGPNLLARFMWRVFFNVHWSRIPQED